MLQPLSVVDSIVRLATRAGAMASSRQPTMPARGLQQAHLTHGGMPQQCSHIHAGSEPNIGR